MGCCGGGNRGKQYGAELKSICPIMGGTVDRVEAEKLGLVREYKGTKYYFCCAGCPEKFEINPESYVN